MMKSDLDQFPTFVLYGIVWFSTVTKENYFVKDFGTGTYM